MKRLIIFLQISYIILKLSNVIDWNWLIVLLPAFVTFLYVLFIFNLGYVKRNKKSKFWNVLNYALGIITVTFYYYLAFK